ncbi:MAG: phosphoglycerate dehydrogenase [Bacteroidetes bacterium]|nr:phosphoglycerate dehydrogenase [Bacteroidota bacterium]
MMNKNSVVETSYPKEKIKILFLENVSEAAVDLFRKNGYLQIKKLTGSIPEETLLKEIKDVHILGIRSKTQINHKLIQAAKKLQAIGCFCIGVNQVDLDAATKNGIAVFNAPYSNTRSVAELIIGLCILLIRKIPAKNIAAHQGKWDKDARGCFELRGKTLGIIGYGNIGTQVSILAESLGMKVLFHDIETKLPLGNAHAAGSLKMLLKASDIVTLHVPETRLTKHLINAQTLKQMKPGAILLNYSRGSVVDLDALSQALKKEHLSGAAIDVFPDEPEKNGDVFNSPLQGMANVILTPHIGGSTQEAQKNIGENVSAKLFDYLEKGISNGSHSIPALSLPPMEGAHRILHIHENIPGILSAVNTQMASHKINILGQYLKTNENIGYVVLDVNKNLSKKAMELLKNIQGTIKVRVLY